MKSHTETPAALRGRRCGAARGLVAAPGRAMLSMLVCACSAVSAQTAPPVADDAAPPSKDEAPVTLPVIVVTGDRKAPPGPPKTPATIESVTAESLDATTNLINTEDALKYLPSLLVRKRYAGDTGAPLATRTTGINASARTLIFADGVLLSTLINNNNGNGSPQWFLVQPGEIERVDVLYGPYSAAYAGNSYGAVVDITTRTPSGFEADGGAHGSYSHFEEYGAHDDYGAYSFNAGIGDRIGRLTVRLGVNHLDSDSQPVTFLTVNQSTVPDTEGAPAISGSHADRNRTGGAIQVLGAGNLTTTRQDSVTLKLGYDLTQALQANYVAGLWKNDASTHPETYLRDADGDRFQGSNGNVDIGGFRYSGATIAGLYSRGEVEQRHLMQSLSLAGRPGGAWSWQLLGSHFDYLKDLQRTSTPRFVSADEVSDAGRIADSKDTGWSTVDAKATRRSQGGAQVAAFGAHFDRYRLGSPVYDTDDWRSGEKGTLFSDSRGKTRTMALWAEDRWTFVPDWTATLGGRYEWWKGYDGFNVNRAGADDFTEVVQPKVDHRGFSPKATLAWQAAPAWEIRGSFGRALRFPTVGELYQNVQTGTTFTQADPFLQPEDVLSGELVTTWSDRDGEVRLTLFQESVKDALISQTSLIEGFATPVSFVQNVDRTRQRGVELSAERRDLVLRGFDLSASFTYADAEIRKNDGYVAPASTPDARSAGRRTPYVAKWRGTMVATYRPAEPVALTLAGRFSSRLYATVDNTDVRTHTYQGFERFFVLDARARWQIDANWSTAVGVDNLNNRNYYLFHPFPQRTAFAEIEYRY